MGLVEENNYLITVEGNLDRLKTLSKTAQELSDAIVTGNCVNLDDNLRTEFNILIEINSLYHDTANILDLVTSEENLFKANRFYKELQEFKPLGI